MLQLRADAARGDGARDALLDKAIAAYKTALEYGSGRAVSGRLIDLLARRGRADELEELRKKVASPRDFDRRLTAYSLQAGLDDLATQTVTRMVRGEPESLDVATLRANVLNRLGKPEEAERTLRDLAEARGGEPGPWFQLLLFQAGRNEPDAAAATAEEIRPRVKGDRPEFLHAQAYRFAGNPKRAGELYREARKKWPEDAGVARAAAEFFAADGREGEAEAILGSVLKADPTASWAARQLAMILSGGAKDAEAWQRAWDLVRPDASVPAMPRRTAWPAPSSLLRSPDPARQCRGDRGAEGPQGRPAAEAPRGRRGALAAGADLPERRPADRGARPGPGGDRRRRRPAPRQRRPVLRGPAARRQGRRRPQAARAPGRDGARGRADRGPAGPPPPGRGQARRGARRPWRNPTPTARAPTTPRAAAGLVIATLLDLKHPEAAERVARAEAGHRPEGGWLLADVLKSAGRPEEAMRACLEAVEKGGSRLAVRSAVALATARGAAEGALEGADGVVTAALKREPDDLELILLRAQVRHLQGRFEEELQAYRDALGRKPSDLGFLNNMAWTLSESLGRPKEAIEPVERAMARAGRRPQFLDTRGVILTRLGRLDEAVKDLEVAARAMPAGSSSLHLARALSQAGKAAEARKALERGKADGKAPDAPRPRGPQGVGGAGSLPPEGVTRRRHHHPARALAAAMTTPPQRRPPGPEADDGPPSRLPATIAPAPPLWADGGFLLRVSGPGEAPGADVRVGRPFALVGRLEGADVRIDDRAVSGRHLYLHLDRRGLFWVDLATRTGTRSGGVEAPSGWLRPGDALEVAGRRIELRECRVRDPSPDGGPPPGDLLADAGGLPLARVTLYPAHGGPAAPRALGSELVFLGRGVCCGVRVEGASASRTHCVLVRTREGAFVVDLIGRGTWLNGLPLRAPAPWPTATP